MIREPFNALSHFLGVLLGIAGLVYLVIQADGALETVAFTVYGVALILLYLSSTLYHALPVGPKTLQVLRRLDHSAIYLFIAGTYTPVCLVALSPGWGWSIFAVVWSLALTGVVVRNLAWKMPRWVYTALYLALGWVAIVGVKPLVDTFPWHGLALLVLGGLAYTVGAVIYATEWPDILPDHVGHHGIWHLSVLSGTGFHYAFIAAYVAG
ncbi:MAG: hemolysin III family protein [Candidatus Thermoplasmatota archaeon]|nr:hemolysin III family protein [Candidatus Thermoplasmatota archaeon]